MRSLLHGSSARWLAVSLLVAFGLGVRPHRALADSIACSPTTVSVGQLVYCLAVLTPLPSPPNSPAIDWGDRSTPSPGTQATHSYASPGTYMVSGVLCFAVGTSPCAAVFAPVQTTVVVTPQAPVPSPTTSAGGMSVPVQASWNLVGGPTGTVLGASGPLYSLGAGDSAYVSSPADAPITGGRGYWAYFAAATSVRLNGAGESSTTVQAPAGQWLMVGNPSGSQAVSIRGADEALAWDAAAGSYRSVTQLAIGQGAWVLSLSGGPITLTGIG